MDYATLLGQTNVPGSIANWVNHQAAQGAAPVIVEEAQSFIYRRLRHWKMKKTVTGNLSTSNQFLTLPTDYLEDKLFITPGVYYRRYFRKTEEEVFACFAFDGNGVPVPQQPSIFYSDQTNFNFDTIPDQNYPYTLMYFQQPAPLGGNNLTNFLTLLYPRLVRCACMAGAAEFMKDMGQGNYDRTYWTAEAEKEILVAQIESDRQVRSQETGMMLSGGGE